MNLASESTAAPERPSEGHRRSGHLTTRNHEAGLWGRCGQRYCETYAQAVNAAALPASERTACRKILASEVLFMCKGATE